jgi:hypothetical protein
MISNDYRRRSHSRTKAHRLIKVNKERPLHIFGWAKLVCHCASVQIAKATCDAILGAGVAAAIRQPGDIRLPVEAEPAA